MKPLVSIRDLRVSLGGRSILRGVDAELGRGQITALLGLNGSGKTTLLRAILKEIPFTGQVRFHCGHDHTRPSPEYIGYVPQKLHIDMNLPMTVRDLFGLALQRRPIFLGIGAGLGRQMEAMLALVGAPAHLLDAPIAGISGGERQRVLLALAIHPNPELLLLDEPAAGIDFKDQQKFYDLIAQLNRERGVTVLLVSHDTSVVSRHAHHVLCLRDGNVQCQGSADEVMKPEMLAQVFGEHTAVYPHSHG
jgi:zinc transport system ATP-binding protein